MTQPLVLQYNWTVVRLGTSAVPEKARAHHPQLQHAVRCADASSRPQVILDTLHFRNNAPMAFCLEGCDEVWPRESMRTVRSFTPLTARTERHQLFQAHRAMAPHRAAQPRVPPHGGAFRRGGEHRAEPKRARSDAPSRRAAQKKMRCTHVLLKIFPCGGVSRLVCGTLCVHVATAHAPALRSASSAQTARARTPPFRLCCKGG
jgi:hypothetical protein